MSASLKFGLLLTNTFLRNSDFLFCFCTSSTVFLPAILYIQYTYFLSLLLFLSLSLSLTLSLSAYSLSYFALFHSAIRYFQNTYIVLFKRYIGIGIRILSSVSGLSGYLVTRRTALTITVGKV